MAKARFEDIDLDKTLEVYGWDVRRIEKLNGKRTDHVIVVLGKNNKLHWLGRGKTFKDAMRMALMPYLNEPLQNNEGVTHE